MLLHFTVTSQVWMTQTLLGLWIITPEEHLPQWPRMVGNRKPLVTECKWGWKLCYMHLWQSHFPLLLKVNKNIKYKTNLLSKRSGLSFTMLTMVVKLAFCSLLVGLQIGQFAGVTSLKITILSDLLLYPKERIRYVNKLFTGVLFIITIKNSLNVYQ